MNDIIRNAKLFRDAGFKIFPIHPFKGKSCLCGDAECPAAGKHPAIKKWNDVPVWSDDQFNFMCESGELDHGFGVLTDGLLVVDIDVRNGGDESILPDDLQSGLRVSSGSGDGSTHDYFLLPDNISISKKVPMYQGIDFISSSSCFVVGPGSKHKSGLNYNIVWGSVDEIEPAPQWILDICIKKDKHRVITESGAHIDVTEKEIRECVFGIKDYNTRDVWLEVGMGIHNTLGDDGFKIWDDWSAQSPKYNKHNDQVKVWRSFGERVRPITFASLRYRAINDGWIEPVTFESDDFNDIPAPSYAPSNGIPFDVSDLDMLKPPGFVGELTDWINSQCLYPRESLAVATALGVVGDIAGLRCILDDNRTKPNLITFCIAGSSTGKEDVLQARIKLLTAAGIPQIQHGRWKSEQEIIKNLIRHDQSAYVIDELGIQLQKINNAMKSGSTPYLEGIIGEVMSLFSKSNGIYALSGDLKEQIKIDISNDIKKVNKQASNGEITDDDATRKIDELMKARQDISQGLINPFLSVLGFSTPKTFESTISYDNLTNGFLARAIIVDEADTNPMIKGFDLNRSDLPHNIRAAISTLHSMGTYEIDYDKRVTRPDSQSVIMSTDAAKSLIRDITYWQLDKAEEEKERTGYEAVWRRLAELTNKISLILAIPSGLRTDIHVRWAFEYCRRNCQRKIELALSKDDIDIASHTAADKLISKILSLLDADKPESAGTIINRCRKYSKDDVLKAIDIMTAKKMIVSESVTHPRNKKTIIKYRRISN